MHICSHSLFINQLYVLFPQFCCSCCMVFLLGENIFPCFLGEKMTDILFLVTHLSPSYVGIRCVATADVGTEAGVWLW